jgi:hypothetical protein
LNVVHFVNFTFIFVLCEESCLLILWFAGDRCDMSYSDEDDSSRRSGAEDYGWIHRSEVGWRCVWSRGDKNYMFLSGARGIITKSDPATFILSFSMYYTLYTF